MARYALKRKVAGGLPGNFRGVCPILNRATEILTQYVLMLLAKGRFLLLAFACTILVFIVSSESVNRFSVFFTGWHETHGSVFKISEGFNKPDYKVLPPMNYLSSRRRFKWQSMKESESKSRVMSML